MMDRRRWRDASGYDDQAIRFGFDVYDSTYRSEGQRALDHAFGAGPAFDLSEATHRLRATPEAPTDPVPDAA
jgi:hypothetical protein